MKFAELKTGEIFTVNGKATIYECLDNNQLGIQYSRLNGKGEIIQKGYNCPTYYSSDIKLVIDREPRRNYQFAASKTGWRAASTFIVAGITHKQAITMGYALALSHAGEVRVANVSNIYDCLNRNMNNEHLGNGIYLLPENALDFLTK